MRHQVAPYCHSFLNQERHQPKHVDQVLDGGMVVITQSPEVKTTKLAQPQSHGKQTNTYKIMFPRQGNDLGHEIQRPSG